MSVIPKDDQRTCCTTSSRVEANATTSEFCNVGTLKLVMVNSIPASSVVRFLTTAQACSCTAASESNSNLIKRPPSSARHRNAKENDESVRTLVVPSTQADP